ncbi:MAG: exopolysaccharide biosynthesis polyprenyl glycosylphosphotransferase, partial [Chloroflexota bacterium]
MFFSPSPRRGLQLQISERRLLIMAGDIVAVIASVLIALRVWTLVAGYVFTLDFILSQGGWFAALLALWLMLASANDFYDLAISSRRRRMLRRLLLITAQTWVVYVLVFFFSPVATLPRLFIIYYGIASFILIFLWRLARPFLVGWVSQPRQTLIVGADWSARALLDAMRDYAAAEYDVRGIITLNGDDIGTMVNGVPVLGTGGDLMNFVRRDRISELIITAMHNLPGETFQAVMDAYEQGITIMPMSLVYEGITGRVPVEHVNDDWGVVLLPIKNADGAFDPYPLFKRMIDIAFALVGLTCFALLLPLIALALAVDSRGGIFYSQNRVGRNGGIIRIYKLRSMIPDAEAKTGAVFSHTGDPRVTRVGRFLRKTRLDELPQLINVLRGDMSMIGPRPERPEHVARLQEKIPFYRTRLIVRPGLTGWAQVRYDYGANDEDALVKLQYDLYYIRHQSLILDVNI